MKIERLRRKKLIFRDPFSLFPAQAGVILVVTKDPSQEIAFPRASGGDPKIAKSFIFMRFFSPRKRG